MTRTGKQTVVQGLLWAAPAFAVLVPVAALAVRSGGAVALAYLFFWLFLPGCAVARWLGFSPGRDKAIFPLAAFFFGAGAVFCLFYLVRLPVVPPAVAAWVLRLAPPAAGLAWALARLFGRREAEEDGRAGGRKNALAALRRRAAGLLAPGNTGWLALWLVAVGVWLSFALTTLAFSGPARVPGADYYWHMGNIHTLASSPGFEDLRVAGMTFRYHYFSDLIWAVGSLAVGLEPFYCVVRYPALIVPALCGLGVWHLMGRATRRPWLRFAAAFAVLFAAPLYGVYNDFTYQWATGINAVGFALPCGLLLLHVGERALRAGEAGWRETAAVGLLAALTAGFKGPFAVCALAALCGGALARRVAGRGRVRKYWLVLLAAVAGFALIWFTLLRAGLNDSYIKSWQPFYSVYTAEVLAPLLTTSLGSPAWLRALLTPLHLVVVLGVLAVPFMAACVRFVAKALRRKNTDDAPIFQLAGAVASLLVFYMLDLTGRSQFYFLYFAVPLAGVVAAREVDAHWLPWLARRKTRLPGAAVALAGLALMVFALLHPMAEPGADYHSADELAAAGYLKEHATLEERVAINRHVVHYFTSGLSGARFWLEGDAYAKNSGLSVEDLAAQRERGDALFTEGVAGKAALADEMGVVWLVQYMQGADGDFYAPPGEGFELAFESADVLIWRRVA